MHVTAVLTLIAVAGEMAAPAPFVATVDDALLASVPPAERVIAGWSEALALVRAQSTDDRAAVLGVERAQARTQQAFAALLPNVRFSTTLALDLLHPGTAPQGAVGGAAIPTAETTPTSPLLGASVTASQALLDFGARHGIEAAEAVERSAAAGVRDTRRRLTQGLARALVAVVAAERVAELNRLGLRQALERQALTVRTMELGAATQLDVVRVAQDVEVARGTLVAGDEQLRRVRDGLGLALGLDHAAGVAPDFQLTGLVEEAGAACVRLVELADRPDLVAAREQVASAAASRAQAADGALPTLALTSTLFGYTTSPLPGRLGNWNLAAVLSMPLYEGRAREALVKDRAGAEAQATQALERTRREVTLELARTRRGLGVAEGLLRNAREARALTERLDALTRKSFEVGRSSSLELVQSAAALRLAEVACVTREFEWVQARLDALLSEATCDW